MADVMPNYQVEIQRLKSQVLDQQAMVQKQILQIFELGDRKEKLLENITATKKSIISFKEKLDGLIKTHGEVTEDEIQKMIDAV